VLVARQQVEARFLFDPTDGTLLAMELFPSEDADDVDPCEIYFSEYLEHDGRLLPGLMEVRYGDIPYATFELERFDFEEK
jgi:hypothetical protein